MVKIKKINKGVFIIIGIILVLLFFFYSGNKPLTITNPGGNLVTSSELISEDSDGATYKFSFSADGIPPTGSCSMVESENLDFIVSNSPKKASSNPPFIDGLDQNRDFDTSRVSLNGVYARINACSDAQNDVSAVKENLLAKCRISKVSDNQASINCRFTGNLRTSSGEPAYFWGLTGGEATIKFYNVGVNPPDDGDDDDEGDEDKDSKETKSNIILYLGIIIFGAVLIYIYNKNRK